MGNYLKNIVHACVGWATARDGGSTGNARAVSSEWPTSGSTSGSRLVGHAHPATAMDGGSAENAGAVFRPPIFARAVSSDQGVSALSHARDRQRGFTLLEVLVAIAIFAMISAMAYSGLANVLRANEHIEKERAAWRELALLYLRMEEDISQMRPRTIRTAYGVTSLPALQAQPTDSRALGAPEIEFTRGGIFLPVLDETQTPQTPSQVKRPVRSDLQRVAYRLNEGVLSRLTWPDLDRSPASQPRETVVLKDVTEFQLRYYVPKAGWVDSWPMIGTNKPPNLTDLPSGVEVRLVLKSRGEFKRLFLIHE